MSGHAHDEEAGKLHANLHDAQDGSSTLAMAQVGAAGHISATLGQCHDVADGRNTAEPAEQHPPRREAIAGPTHDDLDVLREI